MEFVRLIHTTELTKVVRQEFVYLALNLATDHQMEIVCHQNGPGVFWFLLISELYYSKNIQITPSETKQKINKL